MENGQILCTKTETGHLLLIGYRFEMPCGKCIQNITTSFYFTSTEGTCVVCTSIIVMFIRLHEKYGYGLFHMKHCTISIIMVQYKC